MVNRDEVRAALDRLGLDFDGWDSGRREFKEIINRLTYLIVSHLAEDSSDPRWEKHRSRRCRPQSCNCPSVYRQGVRKQALQILAEEGFGPKIAFEWKAPHVMGAAAPQRASSFSSLNPMPGKRGPYSKSRQVQALQNLIDSTKRASNLLDNETADL